MIAFIGPLARAGGSAGEAFFLKPPDKHLEEPFFGDAGLFIVVSYCASGVSTSSGIRLCLRAAAHQAKPRFMKPPDTHLKDLFFR